MNRVFADTSAFIALLDENDAAHRTAARAFNRLQPEQANLITSSYALVETYTLVARRYERRVVEQVREQLEPLLEIVWIDHELHEKGLDRLLASKIRGLSLVDAVSFVIMERERIEEAFAYDRHFEQAGFSLIS